MKGNPILRFVSKVHETEDIDEAAAMMDRGNWVIIAAAKGEDGYLFSLGCVEAEPNVTKRKGGHP